MKKGALLTLIIGFLAAYSGSAQIAIAVAKDENGSSKQWALSFNKGYKTGWEAKDKLKAKGYQRIYTLTGGEKRGHHLTSGYWVVVEARHKIYDGSFITSFGLGASSTSYSEAEKRAVSNLSQYDWSWDKDNGYSISKKGTF